MIDWKQINAKRLIGLHPAFATRVQRFLDHMEATGENVLITQAVRTFAEQDELFAQGRTKPGKIITQARGGFSQHNFGLAVDLCPFEQGASGLDWNINHPVWKQLLAAGPQFKLAEGAFWRTFPDCPHFYPAEIPATVAEMRDYYARGGLAEVWRWFSERTGDVA